MRYARGPAVLGCGRLPALGVFARDLTPPLAGSASPVPGLSFFVSFFDRDSRSAWRMENEEPGTGDGEPVNGACNLHPTVGRFCIPGPRFVIFRLLLSTVTAAPLGEWKMKNREPTMGNRSMAGEISIRWSASPNPS
jgi:hypothetical protein